MSRRSGSISVLAVAGLVCAYFLIASGAVSPNRKMGRKSALAATALRSAQSPGAAGMAMNPVLPLFVTGPNFTSSLVMVNVTQVPTYADVILTDPNGKQITQERVQLPPRSQETADIAALLNSVSSTASIGRITVAQEQTFSGMIGAQLLLTYNGSAEPNYIDEDEAIPGPTASQVLRGVADSPEGSPLVSITSIADTPQTVAIECSAARGRNFTKSVVLPAEGTVVTEACTGQAIPSADPSDIFPQTDDRHGRPQTIGISLTTTGMPGSFAAFGLTPHHDGQRGYFSNIAFVDPKTILSSTTVFTGVPVGFSTVLPASSYTPQVSLANFSAHAARVKVEYARTFGGTPVTDDVANATVAPYATKTIALANLQGDASMQNSFLVSSDGAPGEVIAKLVSTSDSALPETELLAKDEKDPMNGGEHPWSLGQGIESTVLLFNHGSNSETFEVVIDGGGVVWQKNYKLKSMQTVSIQLQDLIDERVKDDKGQTIPSGALEGVVAWFTSGPGIGKGRLLLSSQTAPMARSFSCYEYTILYGAIPATQITSDALDGADDVYLADANQNVASASTLTPPHCSGEPISGQIDNATYSWTSEAPGVATVESGDGPDLYINAVGGGQATVLATITDQYGCQMESPAQVTVQVPTSLSIVSGSDSGSSKEASCASGQCGVTRTFKYQVNDQNGKSIAMGGMSYGDVICNTSTNGLNLQSYLTTCGGTTGSCWGTSGPCGKSTDQNGQFTETLTSCAPVCYSAGTCVAPSAQTVAKQTWYINSQPLNSDVKTVTYECNKILVNGQ